MGIQIGSLGQTYRSLPRRTDDECFEELNAPLLDLRARLRHPSLAFCYPFGQREPRLYELARCAGYRASCPLVHDAFARNRFDAGQFEVRGASLPALTFNLAAYPLVRLARNFAARGIG